jgi:hypothetical protein
MSDTLTLPPPVAQERKCSIEEVFDASFIELLKLVPANPYVRALILKFSGKIPPVECELFDQLKDWVEFNCVKRIRKSPATVQSNDEPGISISVDFSEQEYGRAHYSVERSGSDTFQMSGDDLVEIIRDAIADGGAISAVVEAIAKRIDDDAWDECDPNLDDYGDYEYSEHDSDGADNSETEFSREHIRNAVLRFVQENHPELAAEL